MEKLQFIVREVNKLLSTSYNLLSFDAFDSAQLLQVVSEVLQKLDASSKVESANPSDIVVSILTALQAIKYAAPSVSNTKEFCDGIASGNTKVIYPILEWLLCNQSKIKRRAYLAKYADKIPIPAVVADDEDVMQLYKNYEKIVEEFWVTYKENSFAREEFAHSNELQSDIKKMTQDTKNLIQRNQNQWEKLSNIPNKENLLYLGKCYRTACMEERNLVKQIKENSDLVNDLELQVKNLEDKWSRRGRHPIVDTNIFQTVQEEMHVNKIFLETQLPQELQEQTDSVSLMEQTVDKGTQHSREYLHGVVNQLKEQVQHLTTEKLNLYSSTADKLAPFRKQASSIAQKKAELSKEVNVIKSAMGEMEEEIRGREVTLFNAVGGEILHGDNLKHFIATLREKSVVYKQFRAFLQGLSAELGVGNRTLDVLRTIDPTVDYSNNFSAYLEDDAASKGDRHFDFAPETVPEAKEICKEIMQDIEGQKTIVTRIQEQLESAKKDSEKISRTSKETKNIFTAAVSDVAGEVQRLKEDIRTILNDIDLSENTWKTITHSLDKSEYIFNRLIDEIIDENNSYLDVLEMKKAEQLKSVEDAQNLVAKLEQKKKLERENVEFLKHAEYLIMHKFDDSDD